MEITDHLRPIEIGVTNRICTGTGAFTRRNAAVTSWSPFCTLHSALCTGNGAPGRTRTDEYEFTKLALWLLEARGRRERQNDEGEIPTSRLRFPNWRSHVDLHHDPPLSQSGVHIYLHLESKMASVAGLAPARTDLKGRTLELLCIHGQEWPPRLVSRQRLLLFREALICLSYSGSAFVLRTSARCKLACRAEARRAKAGRPGR